MRKRMSSLSAFTGALAFVFVATQALSQPAPTPAPAPAAAPTPPAPPAQPGQQPATGQPAPGQPAQPGQPGAPGAASATQPAPTPPTFGRRNKPKPLEPPTQEQLDALKELEKEAKRYEKDAKDYRKTLTRIIRHHYEEKRRRLMTAIERELKIETQGLRDARDEAIVRLEKFVAKYSGPNAHPKNTPDAMFRLAALYEERERQKVDDMEIDPNVAPPDPDLSQAIALYKRIVNEFPKYEELAGVFYYLGHAYNDVARIEEAQQVWRALVCRNRFRYPVPPDPTDPTKDSIQRIPQDHDSDFWLGWMQRHPEPMDIAREKAGAKPDDAVTNIDEDVFQDPFPNGCQAIAQKVEPGEDPRYIAEIWWRIGDYHFEEIDPWGGPFNLNRAERAYQQSLKYKKPPVYGVSMYKLAWTYFKQQRYETAVRQFVKLLEYTDEQEKKTGNSGADFRNEAYAYIAGSVTYLDFEGPGVDDPYIARNDIFDLESDPVQVEKKMAIAIERIQDPNLIPQDRKWTVEIYKALAFEYKEYNHLHNLITLNKLVLKKWPMHRDAPFVQNQIAEVYETLASQTRGAEHEKYSKLALEARGKLVDYVATPHSIPPWVEANKEDPEAIRAAERLVRGGLRRAAADHTNAGRVLVQRGRSADDPADKELNYQAALRQYRLAAKAWGGYLLQDENAEDAYESRFWLADAYTNIVLLQAQLGTMPTKAEIEIARKTAREVRDSNEDNKYLQPAGMMVVRIAQQVVKANYNAFDSSGGSAGFEERKELKEVGEGDARTFVKDDIPKPVQELIVAFDEYVQRVPVESDPYRNHDNFAYKTGEIPFLYGQFDQARKRLIPIYQTQCGKTKYAYLAYEKLLTMANKENNFEESRKLAQAAKKKSCAVDADQQKRESALVDPTLQRGYYQEASIAYKKAEAMKDGPERKKAWRKAGELYEGALREAPERDEAPEAAILGATAWKQIGEYDNAIRMYELFIKEYGSEKRLKVLKDGSKDKRPNLKQYKERIKYLKQAYDSLAEAYVLFFDYRRAAQTYETISGTDRFEDEAQRKAARNAVFLYANIGDRNKIESTKKKFFAMNPTAEERAELEWLAATADLKEWDENGQDTGTNRAARVAAVAAMDKYYRRFNRDIAANRFVVQAAYNNAKLRKKGRDQNYRDWCRKTIKAFDKYKSSAPRDDEGKNTALGSIQADMAAECEFTALDEEIKRKFDYDSGHHRYKGVITDIRKDFTDDIEVGAKGWFDKLEVIITKYESRRWAVAARARQGSLYDSCRTGLFNAREPGLKLFTPKQERLLKQLDKLCEDGVSDDACDKADIFRANIRTKWRQTRDKDLATADRVMVQKYTEAILWAKAWKVRVDAVDSAIGRLAFYTDILGDAKLRDYSSGLNDPSTKQAFVYQDKLFLRMRRGMTVQAKPEVLVDPLPVIPQ